MNKSVLDLLKQEKFVAIVRGISSDDIVDVAKALYEGGIRLMETTFNQSSSDPITENKKCLSLLCETMGGKMAIGAGTVLTTQQLRGAYEAGAQFIISPNVNVKVISETKELGLVSIPGAMTPTEIELAFSSGGDVIKLFPADDLGYHYIRNITAPLSHIPIMATGGVNPETIPLFLEAGAAVLSAGISIVNRQLVQDKNYNEITRRARAHIEAARKYTNTKST